MGLFFLFRSLLYTVGSTFDYCIVSLPVLPVCCCKTLLVCEGRQAIGRKSIKQATKKFPGLLLILLLQYDL